MKIDVSFLDNKSTVIWCKTKEEAYDLYENVIARDRSIDARLAPKVRGFDQEKDEEGMGYRFEHFDYGLDVGYGSMWYYRTHGYNIVEFEKLIINDDLGQIESGYSNLDAALAALF